MTARPQMSPGLAAIVCPSPHAPAGGGAEAPRGACLCQAAHRANRPFHGTPRHCPIPAFRLGHGRPEGEAIHGLRRGWAAGRPRTPSRVPAAGWERSAVGARPPLPPAHPPGDTQASCCVSPFPSATPCCTQGAALHAALQRPVFGRGGGNHHCAPTLCARRFSPLPSPETRGVKKGHAQALLSDLRRASSEWQLGLLHAV